MKRCLIAILTLLGSVHLQAANLPRPKLVIGIVVDQMRWDYLYRYYDHFGPDGFRRMMDKGFRCEQAFINYLPSYTAPGHASVYTGAVPAIHGITGNDWIEGGRHRYCTADSTVRSVGGSARAGQMSPRSLLTTTIGDELRLATNLRSRVYAVSLKDRSSILPAGHLGNGAYWLDDSSGNFFSSTFYGEALPAWLRRFNERRLADSALAGDWDLADRPERYYQSSPDSSRYSGKLSSRDARTGFPHKADNFAGKGPQKYYHVRKLPAANTMTFELAKSCLAANALGKGGDPDFLAISFSATDYAGHHFGPNSIEMEDMFVRLDADLAAFFRHLDKMVGAGQYTVFLTADHGAAHNALFLSDLKAPAGNISESVWRNELNRFLQPLTGLARPVISLQNYQINLSDSVRDAEAVLQLARNHLLGRPEVQDVYLIRDAQSLASAPEPLRSMIVNGYHRGRSGLAQIILKPGYYSDGSSTGTTHGTWNPYDTHIPLLWYGWGIPKGATHRELHITDIAATLAALLRTQMPNGCTGKVITEILP